MASAAALPFKPYGNEVAMLDKTKISAFAQGTASVGATLADATPIWIEPYTALGVVAPATGNADLWASFDGQTYYLFNGGVSFNINFVRTWRARMPFKWLKFVNPPDISSLNLPAGTVLKWGAKS